MFRLEVFVEKKHLADVFERLTNIADVQSCALMPNVAKANGKIRVTASDTVELLTKEIHKRKLTEFRGPDFKAMLEHLHIATSSYSHYLQNLCNAGVLRKGKLVGNTMTYHVTGK
jgi:hypothetical protein